MWTWDDAKNARNRAKHGIPFELAQEVFDDPLQWSVKDPHLDGDRWRTIGMVGAALLFVVHTDPETAPDGVGRIISARRATPAERRAYEQG